MKNKTSRRSFLQSSAIVGFTGVVGINNLLANELTDPSLQDYKTIKDLVILFQGDSITDGNRGRNKDPNHIMGHGYAFSIASRAGADFPESNLNFYNRGVSGNKVSDLKKRWQTDTLDIHPDVLSILIGINDASMLVNKGPADDKDVDVFEADYRDILEQAKKQNPDVLLVICLPFVYPVAKVNDNWEAYKNTVVKITERVKKLAAEFNAIVVDFPVVFDKAIQKAPVTYWIWDGIHPAVPAHELMAREWIKQVSKRLTFLKIYKYK